MITSSGGAEGWWVGPTCSTSSSSSWSTSCCCSSSRRARSERTAIGNYGCSLQFWKLLRRFLLIKNTVIHQPNLKECKGCEPSWGLLHGISRSVDGVTSPVVHSVNVALLYFFFPMFFSVPAKNKIANFLLGSTKNKSWLYYTNSFSIIYKVHITRIMNMIWTLLCFFSLLLLFFKK